MFPKTAWLVLACLLASGRAEYVYKHLAGPASEFMPPVNPKEAAVTSNIRILPAAQLSPGSHGNGFYRTTFVADGELAFSIAIVTPQQSDLDRIEVALTSPSGVIAEAIKVDDGPFGIDGHTYGSRGLVFAFAEKGEWTLEIGLTENSGDTLLKVFPIVAFPASVAVTVSTDTIQPVVGETVQLTAEVDEYLLDGKSEGESSKMSKSTRRLGLNNGVTAVTVEIRSPDGKVVEETMKPDGSVDATQSLFTAPIHLTEVGSYQAVVLVRGNHEDGEVFERSAWYWINAVEKTAELTQQVVVTKEANEFTNDEQFIVSFMLEPSLKPEGRYRVYAEIYSTGQSDANPSVPAAWISGLSDVVQVGGKPALQLHLHTAWLAGHHGPYDLVNVRVEEVRSYTIVTSASRMHLPLPADTIEKLSNSERKPITREMREGFHMQRRKKQREAARQNGNFTKAESNKLILVHGYCSSETPYTLEDFTDYVEFQDFKQSRPNDDFARLIVDAGAPYDSFGVVGHSQGGVALLHMYTFYSTGLDSATGDRRIQTLASPYGGTPLSGLLAVIGDFFGFGCGDNQDLSYDGMTKWRNGIPQDSRKELYYYTSQYATGNLINYCLLPANLVLSWPNDGVVEDKATPLDYATLVEHTKGECHSAGMKDVPICHNHGRNRLINSLAAR